MTALASEKGLLAPEAMGGPFRCLLLVMALRSLKGSSPKSRLSPPRPDPSLPPRVRDIRRSRWASRSSSLSSMLSKVKKSGLLGSGLELGDDLSFDPLDAIPRAAKMSFFSSPASSCFPDPLNRAHISMMRSLIDMSLSSRVESADEFFLEWLPLVALMGEASMNCELPRFMSTDRPVAWLEVLRTLALRAMLSKRPRTRPYWALRAALTLVARGVGPILSRWIRYGPFSPRTSRPNDGSADNGVRSVSRLFLDKRLRKNQIKNAIKLMSATPPITPPATAIVEPFPLLPFFPLDPDAAEEVVVPTPNPFVAWAVAPTVEDARENAVVEPRTSLWAAWEVIVVAAAADAVVNGVVDNAAVVVSVTLACGGMATAADNGSCGVEEEDDDSEENEEEAMIENWPIEAEVVAATGGGIVCSIVF